MLDIPILGMKYLDRCKLVIRGNGATGVIGENSGNWWQKSTLLVKSVF